jgi:phosphate-selective porin
MQSIEDESDSKAGYAEAAYFVTKNLQVAGRFETGKVELADAELERIGGEPDAALLKHQEYAFGVNWWFSPDFVFKLSYHMVDGLRFAVPEGEGEPDDKTNTIVAGVSYSF